MTVIPAINCKDFDSAERQVKIAAGFLPAENAWIHIDVVDGKFAPVVTWGNPEDLKKLIKEFPHINFEIHLMVNNPEGVVNDWLQAGAKRLVAHVESLTKPPFFRDLCEQYKSDAGLSCAPATPASKLIESDGGFEFLQVLAVNPGFAGQKFGSEAIKKIEFLRATRPNAKIEVDGGVDAETAGLMKSAGADVLVSASYIFGSADPKKAYEKLKNI